MSSVQEIRELYTQKINLYHKVFFDVLNYDQAVHSFFKGSGYLHPNFKVLDAGCGSGLLTKSLLKISKDENLAGIKFYGFDLTKAMLNFFSKWLKKNKIDKVTLIQDDVLKLKNTSKIGSNYDLIVTSGMLEYIQKKDLRKALINLKRLLKKDGKMIIFISKKNIITDLLIERWWKAGTYGKNEIRDFIIDAGFTDASFKRFPSSHRIINWGMFIIEVKN